GRTAAAGPAPRRLGPAPSRRRLLQARPTDGGDVRGCGGELRAVAAVTRADGHGDAGMVVVRVPVGLLTGELVAAVAVGDGVGAETGGLVDGCAEVVEAGGVGLDEEDVAARTDRGRHVEVEGDLLGPAAVHS